MTPRTDPAVSERLTPSDPDVAVVRRWLDALEAQRLGPRGTVAALVETPRPHEHALREAVTVEEGRGFAGARCLFRYRMP